MDAILLLVPLAMLCAFACLYAGVCAGAASLASKRLALAAQGERMGIAGLVRWRLRNGFSLLFPTMTWLLRERHVALFAEEAVIMCETHGVAASAESLMSVLAAALVALAAFVFLATGSLPGAIAVSVCAVVVAYVVMGSVRDKRNEAVREAVPGALESMAACFGSGFTLLQTFNQVAQDTPGYLGSAFARSAHVLETGGSAQQALAELRAGAHATDLAFVAIALEVQHQSGGSLKQVLEAAGDSVKGELSLRRSLRVQTAQAKLSARVVVVMPFILVAIFALVSPDFLDPFFTNAFGYGLLATAIIMQVAGVLLVHRALSVEGVV